MSYVIYSKNACPNCDIAKKQAMIRGLQWSEVLVRVDIEEERQAFITAHPQAKSFPYITLNGEHLGGLTAFKKHLKGEV